MEKSDKYISYRAYVNFLRKMSALLTDKEGIENRIRIRLNGRKHANKTFNV